MKPAKNGSLLQKLEHFLSSGWRTPIGRIRRRYKTFRNIVAVTGSAGKSTTTRLIAAVLEYEAPTHAGFGLNTREFIIKRFARANPRARYWVQEVSGHAAAPMRESLEFVRPDVAVVTNIQFDHSDDNRTLDDIAVSKGQIVEALPARGIAILNADDERVSALRARCRGKTITYGYAPDADIRATSWREGLPDRLAVTVSIAGESFEVQTQMIGAKWIPNVLAAMACAYGLNISPEKAAEAISRVEPDAYKDCVHVKDGITYVLDAYKGSFWTVPSSIDIVAKARAKRKIIVFGTFTYIPDQMDDILLSAAEEAAKAADLIVWYGSQAARIEELAPPQIERIRVFTVFSEMIRFLDETLREGDLVYVKSSKRDHLERVWHQRDSGIGCFRDRCGIGRECRRCRLLTAGSA